jgi:hypothetical protein
MAAQSNRFEVKVGGGGARALAGVFLMFFGLLIALSGGHANNGSPMISRFAAGGGILLCGVALTFIRNRIVIDNKRRELVKFWMPLARFPRSVYPLDDFQQVTITRETKRTSRHSYTVYPIRLQRTAADLLVSESFSFSVARSIGEEIAKSLRLPLADATEANVQIRQPEDLDLSLRDIAKKRGEPIAPPPKPAGCQIRHELAPGKLRLEIDSYHLSPGIIALLLCVSLLPAIVYGLLAVSFMSAEGEPPLAGGLAKFMAVVAFIPVVATAARIFWVAKSGERLTVTPQALELRITGPFGESVGAIPADEIEELRLRPRGTAEYHVSGIAPSRRTARQFASLWNKDRSIVARSDAKTLSLGRGLRIEEAEWTIALIRIVLTS